jgi:precorrin-2 dehydrogenase/sirohydrochlorin ferrochelatase
MPAYSINISLEKKTILIIGGGNVALRKIKTLIKYKPGLIKIVAPNILSEIKKLEKINIIKLYERLYEKEDFNDAHIVFGATSNSETNKDIYNEANSRGLLCNIIDAPLLCTFTVPSIIKRGDLIISINTSGKCPALSKEIRKKIEPLITKEYKILLDILFKVREHLINKNIKSKKIAYLLRKIINSNILNLIRKKDKKRIDRIIEKILNF